MCLEPMYSCIYLELIALLEVRRFSNGIRREVQNFFAIFQRLFLRMRTRDIPCSIFRAYSDCSDLEYVCYMLHDYQSPFIKDVKYIFGPLTKLT